MNLLFIGNSFSVDVSTYIHQMAESAGKEINVYVLHIGGCPIVRHYKNIISGEKEYEFYENGGKNPINWCDIHYGINFKKWDYISFQQVSSYSGDPNSFFPELPLLMDEVRKVSDAKFLLHMTWSYSKRHDHSLYGKDPLDQDRMDNDIFNAYEVVSKKVNIPYVIPVGKAIKEARKIYGDHLDRDNFHLNELGRTLGGLVWTYYLLGTDIDLSNFSPKGYSYDDITPGVNREDYLKLMEIAKKVVKENKGHNLND